MSGKCGSSKIDYCSSLGKSYDFLDEGIWVKGNENGLEIYFGGRINKKC